MMNCFFDLAMGCKIAKRIETSGELLFKKGELRFIGGKEQNGDYSMSGINADFNIGRCVR